MKRTLAFLLALTLALSLLAGCTSTQESSAPAATAAPAPAASAEPTEAPVAEATPTTTEYTVTDMMGVETTFADVPKTIATFGAIGVLNTFVESLGCGDRIANNMGSRFESTKSYPHLRLEFAPQTADAPLLTNDDGELNSETILQLNPDVCLTMTQSTAQKLRELGMNVIYLEWQELEDVYTAVEIVGKTLGVEDKAQEYIQWFDNTIAYAEGLVADIPEAERKTALYGSITSFSQPHIIAEWWITEAGAISVTNNGRPDTESYSYTAEDVMMWDPDVMLVSGRDQIEELKSNALFADLKAVKNGDIYCVPTVGLSLIHI